MQDDLPTLEKWLSLKGLTCFAIADFSMQPNLRLIDSWYLDLTEQEENVDKKDEKLKMNNFYKLAWLDFKTSLNEVERGDQSLLMPGCVEKNRLFQLKNSHYPSEIVTH